MWRGRWLCSSWLWSSGPLTDDDRLLGPGHARENVQHGPASSLHILEELVPAVSYKGWNVRLVNRERTTEQCAGSDGLTLEIRTVVPDSVRPGEINRGCHLMPVPPTNWGRETWERWVLDQIILVEIHEACEFFTVAAHKPFFPAHGTGENSYEVRRLHDPE